MSVSATQGGHNKAYFARAAHSHPPFPADNAFSMGKKNPFSAIGDATYRKHVRGGPSHGHRQHAQKFGKDSACSSGDILAEDRQTDILITILRNKEKN